GSPRRASSVATLARSASFSSRASAAISLTASNSSRVTTSSSRKTRSAWVRNRVSNSRRIPCAAPAASFIRRAISSRNRLLVCTIGLSPGLRFAYADNGSASGRPQGAMSLLTLPFPAIDPVLVTLGPFAIRWYALAYIFGILFGWLYARALVRSESVWAGKPPFTVSDYDDFIIWVTLGIVLGGRIGYVLFYNPAHFATHPIEMLEVWKGGMSFHGGFLGCVAAVILFARARGISILSLGDVTCAVGPIGLFLGRLANFINGELWGRTSDVPCAL